MRRPSRGDAPRLAGALLLVAGGALAVAGVLAPAATDAILLRDRPGSGRHLQWVGLNRLPEETGSRSRRATLDLRYPSVLRVNETVPVEMRYRVELAGEGEEPEAPAGVERMDGALVVELGASGIDVEPEEPVRVEEGDTLPHGFRWRATGRSRGEGGLRLRIRERPGGTAESAASVRVRWMELDGERIVSDASGVLALPLRVTDYWGVPGRAALLLGALALVAGSALAAPALRRMLAEGEAPPRPGARDPGLPTAGEES